MLSVMQSDNANVMNAFIIQSNVELRSLVETRQQAEELLFGQHGDNVHSYFHPNGDFVHRKGETVVYRDSQAGAPLFSQQNSGEHILRLQARCFSSFE